MAGFWGSLVSAIAVFFPVYFFVLVIGRYIIKYRQHPVLVGFIKGATAGATGAIAGATVILAEGSIIDVPTAIIGLVGLLALWRFRKVENFELLLLAVAAVLGLLIYRA